MDTTPNKYIKLINYADFNTNQVFNCFCTGKRLNNYDAILEGLITQSELDKVIDNDNIQNQIFKHQSWVQIRPGDKIKVITFKNWILNNYTFIIPRANLLDAPTTLEDFNNDTFEVNLHYLTKHCTFTRS